MIMADPVQHYVHSAFRSHEDDIRKLLDGEAIEDGQDAQEALDEYPLAVEKEVHMVITISTGGPHEEIDAVISDGRVTRATFGCYWGSERIERSLSRSDALYQWAESLVEVIR
jgi:hypothetical protein